MREILSICGVGIVSFTSTNIDDFLLLMLLSYSRRFSLKELLLGQLLGMGSLLTLSFLAGFASAQFLPSHWIRFLGLIPIFLGIKALFTDTSPVTKSLDLKTVRRSPIFNIAGLVLACGGDNVALYTPLFASATHEAQILLVTLFMSMTVIWVILATQLMGHQPKVNSIEKIANQFFPMVLIALGIFILLEN